MFLNCSPNNELRLGFKLNCCLMINFDVMGPAAAKFKMKY